MNPEVSILVLNWNQPEYTIPCVKSVLQQEGDFEVVIIDNGSVDNSLTLFRNEFSGNPRIKIVANGENLGYAGGNNEGVKVSNGKYVIVLNNDTLVKPGWLSELLSAIKSDPKVGAVNSYEIREGKGVDLDHYKKYKFRMNLLQYGIRLNRDVPLENVDLIDSVSIKGASFIYKKDLVDLPFDGDYFIYGEDAKLGWILRCKGYVIKTATKSQVYHYHNVTRKENKSFAKKAIFLGERNRVLNILTFYESWTTAKLLPLFVGHLAAMNLLNPRKIWGRSKAYAWVLAHPRFVLRKRKEIKSLRVLSDKDLLKEMTWKLYPSSAKGYD